MRKSLLPLVCCVAVLLPAGFACAQPSPAVVSLFVDATDAPRRFFHARLSIPAAPGALTLVFPKWIPGTHSPSDAIGNLTGLTLSAGGKPLEWRRDDEDLYAFHCRVPDGASAVAVSLDYLTPEHSSHTTGSSANITVIQWETLLLYPRGASPEKLPYQVTLKLPPGWKFAAALPAESDKSETVKFKPVPLTTLIDSPLVAGPYFKRVPLPPDMGLAHELDLIADSAAALQIRPETIAGYERLVHETGALFGCRHYGSYKLLAILSDEIGTGGLEHHECSENWMKERAFLEKDLGRAASLLPHEFVHSWNGKYRRPAGLVTADYQQPMKDELLWVYEGLTQYLAHVLTARCGLETLEQSNEVLAAVAAYLDNQPGRTWRPLADTAVAAPLTYHASRDWAGWRRGTDFYNEGLLIWLDADVQIRRLTGGKRSLDDFCKTFFAGPNGAPAVKPYDLEELTATLNEIAPCDWRSFFAARVDAVTQHAPLGGIENGGWKLTYTDTPGESWKTFEKSNKTMDLAYSIGLRLTDEGRLSDVIRGSPADRAGLAPGMKLIAVNGRRYSPELLRDSVKATKEMPDALELLAENGEFFRSYKLDYHGGARYPHLERDPGTEDVLGKILTPRTSPAGAATSPSAPLGAGRG